jgi:leucyl-tRNA synthetase
MEPSREPHWQEAWAKAGIATARRVPDREKYYAVVAYPGPSGFLHLGHLRGLSLADALVRYHRMSGRQVFFPTGTHASGLPAVAFAQRVANRDPATVAQLRENGVPESSWEAWADPESVARFLGESYLGIYRRLGVLVDESAYLTTVDPDYRSFIQWQFQQLKRRGALAQAPYYASVCPVCGPVSVDPSETDLSRGGDAEVIRYTTVPYPLEDGRVLLTATLRPETVYGVTNLWLHPSSPLVNWHAGGTDYIVSRAGAERLVEQHGGHIGHELRPEELVGRLVKVPFTQAMVPVLSSPVVDPVKGTGVVMSVPAHAPADWLALGELPPDDRARVPSIPEILFIPPDSPLTDSERQLRSGEGVPAERAVRALNARGLGDRAALEEATERLYRLEFVRGRMLVPALGPLSVAEARERMESSFEAAGTGFVLQEFSKPVVCRNGHEVVIRRIPDQWFLHYSDAGWKQRTHDLLRRMKVSPPDYQHELSEVLDWYDDRPCTRRGRWLGTPFPFDPAWVIEPIADSTFYPAYFIVRRFVRSGRLPPERVTAALLDYVFLGEGPGEPTVERELQEELRAEFTYWYPLDVNIGGKEHKRVHFPVFLFNHALLLPPELQPRALFVHWWLVSPEGGKIAKKDIGKKGGAVPPVKDALEEWGADAFRLFYAISASASQDIEWDAELVAQARARLLDVERLAREALGDGPGASPELDDWLLDAMHAGLVQVREAFERMDLREVAQWTYVTIPQRVRRYLNRGGAPGPTLRRAAEAWVRMISPITPHLAEELGENGSGTLVATQPFPDPALFPESPVARAREEYLTQVEEDLQSVVKLAHARGEPPSGVVFYLASAWKRPVEEWLRGSSRTGSELIKEVLERAASHPEMASARGEVAAYAAGLAPKIRSEPAPGPPVEESLVLRAAQGYLARRFQLAEVRVHREEDPEAPDPMNRRHRARPGRPAFYLVGPTPGGLPPSARRAPS